MTESQTRAVAKTTPDLAAEQVEKLLDLFPECVTEDATGTRRIDFARLRATLGEIDALAGSDAYTFTWAGKAEAYRAVQTPSAASLQPVPGESVAWDTTRHLFIEGENLEVLKLLYKSYVGKVKMIYIDPPYNTGNDFIYKDDYREPVRAYLEKTGQVDAEGNVLTSNPETRGRYHSDWLSMMYPRLFLARQLLREDGVIFVSIDDHEVHHLRLLMNEVFGEENFVANIVWQKKQSPQNDAIYFSDMHDHILVYARLAKASRDDPDGWSRQLLPRTEEHDARYSNPDDDPRGVWASVDYTCNKTADERPNLYYAITNPNTGEEIWPSRQRVWAMSREVHEQNVAENRIWWGSDGQGFPRAKRFLTEVQSGIVPSTWWDREFAGDNQQARREVRALFPNQDVFDTPKPVTLIQRMLEIATEKDEGAIVLDFFAGSATTAESVLTLNQNDGGDRRVILVQVPEPTTFDEYPTIADVGKDRVRRVVRRLSEVSTETASAQLALDLSGGGTEPRPATPQDLGFKVFKLAPSTFRRWTPPSFGDPAALAQQLAFFDDGLADGADPLHVVYEVLLKEGYSLNAAVEAMTVGENVVYRITDEARAWAGPGEAEDAVPGAPDSFYLCLDDAIASSTLDALGLDDETVFVCQDAALDDSQKVNLALQCVLKTV